MTATDQPDSLNPDTFDLDAWINGVTRNRAVHPMYARQDLGGRIDELVEQLEEANTALKERAEKDRAIGDDAGADVQARDRIRAELAELWAEYEASGVDFELTQMSDEQYEQAIAVVDQRLPEVAYDAPDAERAARSKARDDLGSELLVLGTITAAGLHGQKLAPKTLTPEQLTSMRQRFGISQYAELVVEVRRLTLVSSGVDAPFSQRVSDALTADTSDS